MYVLQTLFQGGSSSYAFVSLVSCGSPFPLFDLSLVNQLGGTIYRRHVRNSIYNHNIKGLNPSFTYHHHDITLQIVTKQTSEGGMPNKS